MKDNERERETHESYISCIKEQIHANLKFKSSDDVSVKTFFITNHESIKLQTRFVIAPVSKPFQIHVSGLGFSVGFASRMLHVSRLRKKYHRTNDSTIRKKYSFSKSLSFSQRTAWVVWVSFREKKKRGTHVECIGVFTINCDVNINHIYIYGLTRIQ